MSNAVHNPSHYERGGMRCDEAMAAMLTPEQQVGYWYGCAIKCLWRWPAKHDDPAGKIEDVEKAIECLERMKAAAESILNKRDFIVPRPEEVDEGITYSAEWLYLADKAEKKIAELKNDLHFYRQKAEEQHYEEILAKVREERGGHE